MSQLTTALLYVVGVGGMFLLLIAPHEGGHFLFAKLFKVRVIEFSVGAGTKLWSVTRGGTLYAVRAFPILGYVRMGGMEAGDFEAANGFHSKPAWQRIVILAGGPAANFLVAMLLITGFGLSQLNSDPGKVFSVGSGSPAAAAGIQVGDSIHAVNGIPFNSPGLVGQIEGNAPGAPLTLSGVHANGQPFTYSVTPRCDAQGKNCLIGVGIPRQLATVQSAVVNGVEFPFAATGNIVQGLWSLISGQVPGGLLGSNGLTGPIGIADTAAQAGPAYLPPPGGVALGRPWVHEPPAAPGPRRRAHRRGRDRSAPEAAVRQDVRAQPPADRPRRAARDRRGDHLPRHPADRDGPVPRDPLMVTRRKSIPVNVGGVVIGGAAPIAVQTMTKTDTRDVKATLRQIHELKEAGCEIVRPAVPDHEAAEALKDIVKGSPLPVIADIHYDHTLALLAIEAGVHCLRLNPGNIPDRDKVVKVVTAAKERQIPFRIGVNAGSLPEEVHKSMREQHAIDRDNREQTADRMVEVALGHCKILEDLDYGPGFIKVSLKATDVWTNIMANRKFAAARPYPIHLGVTESGPVEAGSIRSAVGMGILLAEGIGDTIRVSLATSDPREEVRVAHEILKTLAFRNETATLVACPTCGRLEYDMVPTVKAVEAHIARLKVPITIAVMGCVVNGPAEARHADIGVTGGRGKGVIFKKGKLYRTVPQEELLAVLLAEIDAIAAEPQLPR